MSKDDIDKAVKEAEQFAAEDKKRREEVDVKNEAEQVAYQAEKLVTDNGDKLEEADKETINTKVAATKSAIEGGDIEAIKTAKDDLMKALQEIGAKLYQAAAAAQQAQGCAPDMGADPTQGAPNADPNVYDADYTDVE
jgi:molecular chaperone DnaK